MVKVRALALALTVAGAACTPGYEYIGQTPGAIGFIRAGSPHLSSALVKAVRLDGKAVADKGYPIR